jgi:hypothetical protein
MKFIRIGNQESGLFFNLDHVTVITTVATTESTMVKVHFTSTKDYVELFGDDAKEFIKQCEDFERREIIKEGTQ